MENSNDTCKIKRWDQLKALLNNLSPQEAQAFLAEHPDCMIIDCRKPEEFAMVRMPKAHNIDYLAYDFWERVRTISPEQPILVYCNTSRRSTRACTLMRNGGFSSAYNLGGGLQEWINELGDQALVRGN